MKTQNYILIALLMCRSLCAEEKKYEKLLNFEGVTVREVQKDSIRIMHKAGFTTIPIEDLPQDIREELGMSMDGVEEHRERAAAEQVEQARKARIVAANKKVLAAAYLHIEYAKVFQVVDGGVLADVTSTWDGTYKEVPQYETKTYRVGNSLSGYRTESREEFTGNKKVKNTNAYNDWLIFVSCDTTGLVDGDKFAGDVWAVGTFSYTTAMGARKTIPKYTADPEEVIINR